MFDLGELYSIPEKPVVHSTLEFSSTEIAGSSQSCVPCSVILSLVENDEQGLQLNFYSILVFSSRYLVLEDLLSQNALMTHPYIWTVTNLTLWVSLHLALVIYMVQVVR